MNIDDPAPPSESGDWHQVIEIAATESGERQQYEVIVGARVVAVFRHAERWHALDGMCAHQGGPLASGHVQDGCVTCPWHGWQYELETGIQTINRQPLQETYPVRVRAGFVEVWVPD